jgi:hypothetical protein
VPKPDKYLVLYADGRAEAVTEAPPDIVKAVQEAEAKKKQGEPKKDAPKAKAPAKPVSSKSTLPKVPIPRLPGGQVVPLPPALPGI